MKMEIKKNLVSESKYNIKCPYAMTPEFVTVHNTANDAPAKNEIAYMISNNNEVSFHYAVDDVEVVQGIPTNRNTWNAGDGANGRGNRKGIAIEICYSKSGGDRFIKAEKNAAKFIASILKEKGWGIDRVKKHQDFNGKYCPHRTLDMGWDRFINMVKAELNGNTNNEPVKPVVNQNKPVSNGTNMTGDITYQVYDNVKGQWLPEVVNFNDYAGNLGHNIGGIRAKCKNGKIYIQTHSIGFGWNSIISSDDYRKNSDYFNSYSGIINNNIDMVKIWSDYGEVDYQAYVDGVWLDVVNSKNVNKGTADSYAGIVGRPIQAIRMK